MDLSYYTTEELLLALKSVSPMIKLYFEDTLFFVNRDEVVQELKVRGV